MAKNNKPKVFVLGWDAADWKFINPLLDAGLLPALQRVVDNGVIGNISTLDPPLSPILWTSIATGKYGDEHGVLNFVEPSPETGKRRPISNYSRNVRAIWNILTHEGYKTHVLGWWPSYPAEPINGICVSNHFADVTETSTPSDWELNEIHVHPKDLKDELTDLRIHPGDLTWNHIAPFIPEATKTALEKPENIEMVNALGGMIAHCSSFHNIATHILETKEWDFIGLYLDTIDKASHFFMKFHPPQQKHISDEDYQMFKDVMTGIYVYHDMMLDRLLDLFEQEEVTLMILSDHGFYSDHRRLETLPKDSMAPAFEHSPWGMICMQGPGIKKDERIHGSSLIDITPTLLHLFGLPVGKDMPGNVLQQAFIEPKEVKTIESWENLKGGDWGELPEETKEDVWAAQEALQQLIDLGYVDALEESDEKLRDQILFENKYHIARIKISIGKIDEAKPILEELHKLQPNNSKILVRLVNAHLSAKNIAEARRYLVYLRQIHGTTNTPHIDFLEGRVLMEEYQTVKALNMLRKAANSESATSDFFHVLGRMLLVSKEWDEAKKVFKKAIKLDVENAKAYHGLCIANLKLGKFQDAIEAGITAVGIRHHFPNGHYHLGEALYKMELYDHAANAFEMALFQQPGFGLARKYLVDIYSSKLINKEREEFHAKILNEKMRPQLTIVSGLPRSGTSMMMQMLQNGGASILTDNLRENDENNPKGYLEFEPVKKLTKDNSWIKDHNGKTVKIIMQLLSFIDMSCDYKIIFMERDIEEIVKSQQKMLGQSADTFNAKLMATFEQQKEKTRLWLDGKPNIEVLYVPYKEVISNPKEQAERVNLFLNETLNLEDMLGAIDPTLYRNKKEAIS